MAIAGFIKALNWNELWMIILKILVYFRQAVMRFFSDRSWDQTEEEKIEALAQHILYTSSLLNDKKFIPYGPAYSKLPDGKDMF